MDLALERPDRLLMRRSYFLTCPGGDPAGWWRTGWRDVLRRLALAAPVGSVWTVESSLDLSSDPWRAVIEELEALSAIVGSRHRLRVLFGNARAPQVERVLEVVPPGLTIAIEADGPEMVERMSSFPGVEHVVVRVTSESRPAQMRRVIEKGWEHSLPIVALMDGSPETGLDMIRDVEGFAEIVFATTDAPPLGAAGTIPVGRVPEVAA